MSTATEQAEMGMEVARVEDSAVAADPSPAGSDLNSLMRVALEQGSVDALERLVALQERVAERQAEAAMAEALMAFQAACPPVIQSAKADRYTYAPLNEVVRTIRPHLAEHGLSYTHDSRVVESEIEVTCTLRHVHGATRTATFRGPADGSGKKNPLQAVGSARSYGRRYTLMDVLGLVTEDDDDGRAAGAAPAVTADQADELDSLADEVGADKARFLRWMGVESFAHIPARDFKRAVKALEGKRGGS
ncbi:MAG TPA: ERF family protein [Longimicrobiales bacterium]|nr:ERF family protein [Longimicrobiales bacterium]